MANLYKNIQKTRPWFLSVLVNLYFTHGSFSNCSLSNEFRLIKWFVNFRTYMIVCKHGYLKGLVKRLQHLLQHSFDFVEIWCWMCMSWVLNQCWAVLKLVEWSLSVFKTFLRHFELFSVYRTSLPYHSTDCLTKLNVRMRCNDCYHKQHGMLFSNLLKRYWIYPSPIIRNTSTKSNKCWSKCWIWLPGLLFMFIL